MSKTRVCFVSLSAYGYFDESAPAGGGAQRQFYLLSTHLTDEFNVHFVVGDYGQPRTVEREGVTLHRAYHPDRTASVRKRGRQLLALYRALRRADADVYATRCAPRKFVILSALVAPHRRPLVYHVATDAFLDESPRGLDGVPRWLYAQALRRSPVVAQTEKQARQLRTNWGVEATVVPNGYPAAAVRKRHHTREGFLWIGRLNRTDKRPHLFLDLAAEFPDEQFTLVGPTGDDEAYTCRVRDRAAETRNVTDAGAVSPSAIHDYYRDAIALVNTSPADREGFPNTFLEAWRVGTPVLSLAVNTRRFLADGPDSHLGFAGGEFDRLVSLARTLADDSEKRRTLGRHGLDTFEARYRLSTVVDDYSKVLRSTVSRS